MKQKINKLINYYKFKIIYLKESKKDSSSSLFTFSLKAAHLSTRKTACEISPILESENLVLQ